MEFKYPETQTIFIEGDEGMNCFQQVSTWMMILLSSVFLFQFPTTAQATSDYPDKPIQVLVGWSAGASEDMRARGLVPKLQEVLGQPVVVVNKPGAASTIALTLVAKAKPDGYTIASSPAAPVIFLPHQQKLEYDPMVDFTYIAGTAVQPFGIAVKSDAPWKTLKELIDHAKNNPGEIKYGSAGIGTPSNIYMEMLAGSWNFKWTQVPFKGDQPAITALLGGHIPVACLSSTFAPQVRSGKLKVLALLAENRLAAFPQIPTLKELGVNFDLRAGEILGFCGPKGLPKEIVGKLENAFKQAVESPEYKQTMVQLENEARFRDSQTFTKLVHEVYPRIGEMIKQLGLSKP